MYNKGDIIIMLKDCCSSKECPYKKGTKHTVEYWSSVAPEYVSVETYGLRSWFLLQTGIVRLAKPYEVKDYVLADREYNLTFPVVAAVNTSTKCDCNWTDVLRYGCTKHV